MKNILFLLLILGFSGYAIGDCPTGCQNVNSACPPFTLVTYSPNLVTGACNASDTGFSCADPQSSCIGGVCQIQLYGRLFVPGGRIPKGGFPTIILSHGSASDDPHWPGDYCGVIKFFVDKGYVVFMPFRYGYSLRSDGSLRSSGTYDNDPTHLAALGTVDVFWAVDYLKANAPVNPKKIAYIGHSYGGITSIFANGINYGGQQATVSISGDSESWGNDPLKEQLFAYIDSAKAPIFYLEPKNDVDINPTVEFFKRSAGYPNNFRSQGTIFAPVSYAPTAECAHICFVYDDKIIKVWGNTVIDFLKRMGVS